MRLSKAVCAIVFSASLLFGADEQININFKNLDISDLVKISSKILNKNILLTDNISGQVDFVSNKAVYKSDLIDILLFVLDSKGYTIVENGNILRVVKLSEAARNNLPLLNSTNKTQKLMATEIISCDEDANQVSARIRHLISANSKIVTDTISNSIVLTDYAQNIETVKKVINALKDSKAKEIKIVELQNVQVNSMFNDIQTIIKSLFVKRAPSDMIVSVANKNGIVLVGISEDILEVEKIIKDLDTKGENVSKLVEVINLQNIESKSVMTIINDSINKKTYKNPDDKPMISGDEETNSIVFIGSKEDSLFIKDLVNKLDVDKQQVYVQARIIEVSERKTREVGIKYGIEGLKTGSAGALTFAGNMGGSSIALSNSILSKVSIPNITDGIALGASINLLNQNGALDVVSEPSILCINNKESSIYVGETRSIKTGSTTSTGAVSSDTYKREDIGLKLKVKPRISSGNKVTLEIETILEDIKNEQGSNGQADTTKKEVKTLAIVNNGESIILGGLIKNKLENIKTKVPFFGDIPLLGSLFRNNSSIEDKINLVIVLTPYIISKSENLASIRNQLAILKGVEDKYTKDVALKLEQNKLENMQEEAQRENQINEVKESIAELENEKNKKVDTKNEAQ